MRLDDDGLLYRWWDAVLSFDPTGSTPVLEIDGTRYTATWQGSPVQVGSTWTQTARTTMRFSGSAVTVTAPDVKLTAGRRQCQWLVDPTADGQKVPGTEFTLDVK